MRLLGLRERDSRTSGRSAGTSRRGGAKRQLSPRQRQGLLLVVIAAVGLLGVFLLIANYVSGVAKQVGPKINVLVLTAPVAQFQSLSPSVLGEVSLPAKWAPRNALRDPTQTGGLVAGIALPSGTELQQGMLVAPPALQPGQQEIAILVAADTGDAGRISPGSLVTIVATFQGNNQGIKPSSRVVVADVKVLSVGTPAASGGSAAAAGPATNQELPVTFALTPSQVLRVSYAATFAQKVRLSLVAPDTTGPPARPSPYRPGL